MTDMRREYAIADGPFQLIVTLSGVALAREMLEHRRTILSDPRLRPGMNALYDLMELDLSALSNDDIRALADDSRRYGNVHLHAAAIAAQKPLAFGLARMFEAYASTTNFAEHMTVVDSVPAAYAWLASLG
jgi:hypothetical protein